MSTNKEQLALVIEGRFYLWSNPNSPAELSSDPPQVGHPRAPLTAPEGTRCAIVTELGPEGYAEFTAITDPVQILQVEALFELRRG